MLEFIIPNFSFLRLLTNRECGIIEGTVFEVFLAGILHLNDKLLTFLILTIYIEYCLAVCTYITNMLTIKECYVFYNLFTIKQRVEKIN